MTPSDLAAALAGASLGFSLIVAIGAQNAYVLRQGIRREHVLAVVAVCALSDLVLITLGIAGTGAALAALPWLMTAVRIAGALFLAGYGLLAARRAWRPSGEALVVQADADGPVGAAASGSVATAVTTGRRSLLAVIGVCLAVTWLNPHVYLDITLIGTLANGHGDARWWFGAGVGASSVVWFSALGFGARALAPVFARPLAWRILDAMIALVMLTLAALVLLPLIPS